VSWLKKLLRALAVRDQRYDTLYRRVGKPDGHEWAQLLRERGDFYAMGDHCYIDPNAQIEDRAYIRLGHNVRIATCMILGHDGVVNMINRALGLRLDSVGKVDIRDNVYIGYQSIILPGVTIGPNAIVTAGSVVHSNVAEGDVVAGVPAKRVGRFEMSVEILKVKNSTYPWRHIIEQRARELDPEMEPELVRLRVEHFYGAPPELQARREQSNGTWVGTMGIIRALLTASLCSRSPMPETDAIRAVLKQGSSADWERALRELELHKVLPLIGYTIAKSGLQEMIPANAVKILMAAYKKTLLTNRVFLNIAGRVIRALRDHDIEPTVFKGVVLADSFYPDPGTRSMVDVDFLIRPGEGEAAARALGEVGFKDLHAPSRRDAWSYGNRYGVLLDVHHTFRLFEGKDLESLTVNLKPRHIDLERLRVWEPNAMFIHLVTHLEAHREGFGYRLSWLIDLGFLVQRWGTELDWYKLRALVRNERSLLMVIRLLRFLERELGVAVPAMIAPHGGTVRPLSLKAVLRSARLAPWGLPRPRGWARLLACRLGVAPRHNRSYPNLSDLFLWPEDFALEKAIPGKIAREHPAH